MDDLYLNELFDDAINHTGNCFPVAAQLVVAGPFTGGRVCHGLPRNQSPEHLGKRYWHAWVEATILGRIIVFDFSNGLAVARPRQEYYELGSIRGADVRRFTREEAVAEMAERADFGPWVDGWEAMAEI